MFIIDMEHLETIYWYMHVQSSSKHALHLCAMLKDNLPSTLVTYPNVQNTVEMVTPYRYMYFHCIDDTWCSSSADCLIEYWNSPIRLRVYTMAMPNIPGWISETIQSININHCIHVVTCTRMHGSNLYICTLKDSTSFSNVFNVHV